MAWSYGTLSSIPRDVKGVYAFWFRITGRCIYVGESSGQSIKKRLRDHWRSSHSELLQLWMSAYGEHFDLCWAEVAQDRIKTVERRLIKRWKPEVNIHHNR